MVTAERPTLDGEVRGEPRRIRRPQCPCGRFLTLSGLCVKCNLPELLELTQRQ